MQFDENGQWVGWSRIAPGGTLQLEPEKFVVFNLVEGIIFGPWAGGELPGPIAGMWLALLGLLIWKLWLRRAAAEAMLAVAVVCTLCWGLQANYTSWKGLVSNGMLWWGGALLIISVILLWRVHIWAGRESKFPHCLDCGYNLTGNISGTCPECGNAVPKEYLGRLVAKKSVPIRKGSTNKRDIQKNHADSPAR